VVCAEYEWTVTGQHGQDSVKPVGGALEKQENSRSPRRDPYLLGHEMKCDSREVCNKGGEEQGSRRPTINVQTLKT